MRYRYILNGAVQSSDKISDYRLLDKQKLQGRNSSLRVEIPDDVILEKWECDEYSTWDSKNEEDYEIKDLNPKICIRVNGRWQVLEDATQEWVQEDKEISDVIQDNIKGKFNNHSLPILGYVTKEQYEWYRRKENVMYSWRFQVLPADLEKAKFPPLHIGHIKTINFVREEFLKYYEEIVDNNELFKDDEKGDAKKFYKDFIKNVSNDELAYRWHLYSATSLDPYRNFEYKEDIEKMKKSKYCYVYPDHYKHAIRELMEQLEIRFMLMQGKQSGKNSECDNDYDEDEMER